MSILSLFVVAQGDMHPTIGFPPNCNLSVTQNCAPTYEDLSQASALWSCPGGERTSASTWPKQCVAGSGTNPLCPGKLTEESPCCCPKDGCYAEPAFNPVIGVCKGGSCACGSSSTRAPSCVPQGEADLCGNIGATKCTGTSVACCFGHNVERLVPYYDAGTSAKINYVAAYQFDATANEWRQQPASSFNTDGALPTFDLMQPYAPPSLLPLVTWLSFSLPLDTWHDLLPLYFP